MAQAATMGPPLSPREPRRSGRRSAPSASASTSKSPDSDSAPPPPRVKEGPNHRRSLSTSTTNGKGKRPKTEDLDDAPEDGQSAISPVNGSSTPHSASGNGRNKRKPKEKDRQVSVTDSISEASSRKTVKAPVVGIEDASVEPADDEEDDQGVTRCVCGSTGTILPSIPLLLMFIPFSRGRPRCWGVHGTVRDVQSLAAWPLYGLRI